jgi:hypothetical protein
MGISPFQRIAGIKNSKHHPRSDYGLKFLESVTVYYTKLLRDRKAIHPQLDLALFDFWFNFWNFDLGVVIWTE